ncbi:response regulator [Patescibacteria group bacterium]|nr:MAG: response regulator [Patescibacteria group bacterium]
MRIVIVEDEVSLRELYRRKFAIADFTVDVASNGAEGLAVCEKTQPDIILLDLRMPVMSGDEMLEKLRQTDWGASIRVVVLTNISRDEAPAKLRYLNVDRYIVKAHHTPAQILQVVNDVLGLRNGHG